MWLAALERPVNRAFFAAGFANALAAKQLCVTLIEIGGGLPNIGYYYALDPAEYVVPIIDGSRFVVGSRAPYTRFASAARADVIGRYVPSPFPGESAHVLAMAFEYIDAGEREVRSSMLEDISRRLLPSHSGLPDAVIAFDAGGNDASVKRFIDDVRGRYPETLLFRVTTCPMGELAVDVDESIVSPEELKSLWSSRAVPTITFFDGLVSNLLQVLSHRRRKAGAHAVR